MTAKEFLRRRWASRRPQRKGWIGTMINDVPPMLRIIPEPPNDDGAARDEERRRLA